MKLLFYSSILTLIFLSCNSDSTEKNTNSEEGITADITEKGVENIYYPSGELQITGKVNPEGLKEGIWISYFENGQKNSESNFKNGINEGYSMVWYPNGNVRYFGDYRAGEQVGEWIYYDENGKISKTQSY